MVLILHLDCRNQVLYASCILPLLSVFMTKPQVVQYYDSKGLAFQPHCQVPLHWAGKPTQSFTIIRTISIICKNMRKTILESIKWFA